MLGQVRVYNKNKLQLKQKKSLKAYRWIGNIVIEVSETCVTIFCPGTQFESDVQQRAALYLVQQFRGIAVPVA